MKLEMTTTKTTRILSVIFGLSLVAGVLLYASTFITASSAFANNNTTSKICLDGTPSDSNNHCGVSQLPLHQCDNRKNEFDLGYQGDWDDDRDDQTIDLCTTETLAQYFATDTCRYNYKVFDKNSRDGKDGRQERFQGFFNYDEDVELGAGYDGRTAHKKGVACVDNTGCPANMRVLMGEAVIRYGTFDEKYPEVNVLCVTPSFIGELNHDSQMFVLAGGREPDSFVEHIQCGDNIDGRAKPAKKYADTSTIVGDQYKNNHHEVTWLCGSNSYAGRCPANTTPFNKTTCKKDSVNENTGTSNKLNQQQINKLRSEVCGKDQVDGLDTDGDFLADNVEIKIGTDINNRDTDGDGLPDQFEFCASMTNPNDLDTDSNGTNDDGEDLDNDSLTNMVEYTSGTHPMIYDEGAVTDTAVVENIKVDIVQTSTPVAAENQPARPESKQPGIAIPTKPATATEKVDQVEQQQPVEAQQKVEQKTTEDVIVETFDTPVQSKNSSVIEIANTNVDTVRTGGLSLSALSFIGLGGMSAFTLKKTKKGNLKI